MELTARVTRLGPTFGSGESRIQIARAAHVASSESIPSSVKPSDITIKGRSPGGELVEGMTYRLVGDFRTHPKHGVQFNFTSLCVQRPVGKLGTIKYLTSTLDGIGPQRALKIWEEYGPDSLIALRDKPREVAARTGLTVARALAASETILADDDVATSRSELFDLLSDKGIHAGIIRQLVERYELRARDIVVRNPYVLLSCRGVGFNTADRVFLALGGDPSSMKRQVLCMVHGMREDRSGSTWLSAESCRQFVHEKVSSANVEPDKALRIAERARLIERHGDWVALKARANDERIVAEELLRLMRTPPEMRVRIPSHGLSDHQIREASRAFSSVVGVLEGSPGTGKTHTVARIIKEKMLSGMSSRPIRVVTFTGKAAQRADQCIRECFKPDNALLGPMCSTIHSLLKVKIVDSGLMSTSGYEGNGWEFEHDATNPLPVGLYIIDEASMNGVEITARLLESIPDGSQVVFVGDTNQLPPVEHGCVMRDILGAPGVGVGRLVEPQRNGGMIVRACADIRDHGRFDTVAKFDEENGHNLVHIESNGPRIMSWIDRMMDRFGERNLDQCDYQVITATNALRDKINERMQSRSSYSPPVDGCKYRLRDKVICRKNGVRESDGTVSDLYIANGQQGTIVSISHGKMTIAIGDSSIRTTVSDQDFELAYAITAHLSQGDEWPFAVVVFDDSWATKSVMSREWLTTAISRGKRGTFLIGPRRVVVESLAKVGVERRRTMLRDLLDVSSVAESVALRKVAEIGGDI